MLRYAFSFFFFVLFGKLFIINNTINLISLGVVVMKALTLVALCLIFLFLSLSINGTLASMIKTIIAWGGFLFFALVMREMWRLRYGTGKNYNKWDEDP